jgi:uncharacterized coiled-coil DUF342 family protein
MNHENGKITCEVDNGPTGTEQEYEDALDDLTNEIDRLKVLLNNCNEDVKTYKFAVDSLKKANRGLQVELDTLERKVHTLEEENRELRRLLDLKDPKEQEEHEAKFFFNPKKQ